MQTAIDGAGRLVVPKSIRDAMGLTPGRKVDVAYSDGKIVIEVVPLTAHVEMRGRVPVIVPDEDVAPLTPDAVRETLDAVRREHS